MFDEFASGKRFEQCQVVERLPDADESRLQSLSTAESPKQDRCGRPSAKHSDIRLLGSARCRKSQKF